MKIPEHTQSFDSIYAKRYDTNYDGVSGYVYEGPGLDDEIINAVKKVDGIDACNADIYTWAHLDDAKVIGGLTRQVLTRYDGGEAAFTDVEVASRRIKAQSTLIHANSNTSLSEKFRSGAFTLVEGRHINQEDVHKTLISEELAELNDLHIGDTITISSRLGLIGSFLDSDKMLTEQKTLEIVGIYRVHGYQPTGKWVPEYEITYNWLMIDMETFKQLDKELDKAIYKDYIPALNYYNLTFFVDDPTQLESVVEQVRNLDTIEKDFYDISIDDSMYKSTVEPLKSIRNIVLALVAVIVVGCTVVLMIVFTMWVRSRKQEISIYLSLGLSKVSIFGQFVLEAAIVAILAGVLAFGFCQEVPNMIGNYMLADAIKDAQPEITEPTREEIHQAAQAGTMSELFQYESGDYAGPEQIDFTFHISDFFVMLLLELLIIVAAILKGGWFIFSMQPRKIMTDLR